MKKSIRQSGIKIVKLQEKLRKKQAENRYLRQRVKELYQSRDHQRLKVKHLRSGVRFCDSGCSPRRMVCLDQKIRAHKYDLQLVSLCICLYSFAGCSLRGVHRVLLYLQLEYGVLTAAIPSKSSIDNWVQKVGLYYYRQAGLELWPRYCLIVDESMVVGQQRMLVVLAGCAEPSGDSALDVSVVKVLGFAVKASWKWEDVRDFLQKAQEKVGRSACYVVCDGAANLQKGVAEAGLVRICDVGHEICKWVDQSYRTDARFIDWIGAVTKVRFQVFMKPQAYLMPPKQRTVARFTNLSVVVTWAANMLKSMVQLSESEQQAFGWLVVHRTLIAELTAVFEMTESILKILKKEGISVQNIERSILICQTYSPQVPDKLIDKIIGYLKVEKRKLPCRHTKWQASSDVLESIFGKYKHKAAANALHGVTGRILSLCIYTHEQDEQQTLHNDIRAGLQQLSMANLSEWKAQNLFDNQILRRNTLFKKCTKN